MGGSEERKETCAGDLIGSVQGEVRRGNYRRSMPSTFWFICLAFVNEVTGTIAIRGALKNDRTFIRSRWIERTQNPRTSCNKTVNGWLRDIQVEGLQRPFQAVCWLDSVRSDTDRRNASRLKCLAISLFDDFAS